LIFVVTKDRPYHRQRLRRRSSSGYKSAIWTIRSAIWTIRYSYLDYAMRQLKALAVTLHFYF